VDINDYAGKAKSVKNVEAVSSPKSSAAPTPTKKTQKRPASKKQQSFTESLSPVDVQQLIQFQQQQLIQQRLHQVQLKQQQQRELLERRQQQLLYQQQQLIQKLQQQQFLQQRQQHFPEVSITFSSDKVSQKKPAKPTQKALTPFLFDYLTTTSDLLPDLTVSQAVELEKLIDKSPNVPTPDQVSHDFGF